MVMYWKMLRLSSIFLLLSKKVSSLTCKDVLAVSDFEKIKLYELQSLSPQDVLNCFSYLKMEKLTLSQAQFIWRSIAEFYSGVSNIPEEILSELHWVTVGIALEDYQNLTLDSLNVITNFGFDYGLTNEQLKAIADRIRLDFGDKEPEEYSSYDLTALRQILCVFNKAQIQRIRPKAFKEVAQVIGKLKNCNFDVLQGFATLSIHKEAFGSPDTWSNSTIRNLGVVAEHLPEEITVKLKKRLGSTILKNQPDAA